MDCYSGQVAPGKIVELEDRTFKVDTLHRAWDGTLQAISAKCLDPREGDDGPWWDLEITDEDLIVAHSVH